VLRILIDVGLGRGSIKVQFFMTLNCVFPFSLRVVMIRWVVYIDCLFSNVNFPFMICSRLVLRILVEV
jgi:hypothetical protein